MLLFITPAALILNTLLSQCCFLSFTVDKMSVAVLTAIMVTVAMTANSLPCEDTSPPSQYKEFIKRHILQDIFDRSLPIEWERWVKKWIVPSLILYDYVNIIYRQQQNNNIIIIIIRFLKRKGLWCRTSLQSFIESSDQVNIEGICSQNGRRLINTQDNLCISSSVILVYDIQFLYGCNLNVIQKHKPVIVACNNVKNRCRPVHFEKYKKQTPSTTPCSN